MSLITSASEPGRLWRRALKPVLVLAALVVVFAWLLPQFIDYEDVWDALTQLDPRELVLLFVLGLGRVPTEALMYRACTASAPRGGSGRGHSGRSRGCW